MKHSATITRKEIHMRMEKRKFRIGELAEHLSVEKFVIRFWEKEFNVRPTRSDGGQRFYDEDDARIFAAIKELLYDRGFTIAGARKELPNIKGARKIIPTPFETEISTPDKTKKIKSNQRTILRTIKQELMHLRTIIAQLR